jgi:hypothetical protein
MSTSFYISSPAEPPPRTLLAAIGFDNVRTVQELRPGSRWADRYWQVYRPGVSARPVEVTYEDGRFQVRVVTPSAPEDFELAFRLLEAAAKQLGRPLQAEVGEPFAASELRKRYPPAWVRGQIELGVEALRSIVRDEQQTVTLSGPVRPFFVGPRLLAKLEAHGPPEELSERFLDLMKQIQYLDPEAFFPADITRVHCDSDNEDPITFAVWGPGVRYLFPDVQYLVLMGEAPGRHVFIPYAVLPELAGDNFLWLDEVQSLVQAIDEDDWPALLDRARQYEVHPLAEAAGGED